MMIQSFWHYRYLTQRIREVAEEYGISVKEVNERGTSSQCPWCGGKEVTRYGRLLKCKACKVEAHRDVVGVLNIGAVQSGERVNRVMAHLLGVQLPRTP